MPYGPHAAGDRERMLEALGIPDVEALFDDIPVALRASRLDLPGLALGTSGLFSLTYALIEANQRGWGDPLIVASLVVAGVVGVAGKVEARREPAEEPAREFTREGVVEELEPFLLSSKG